ncbi:tRNA pseudouridine(55) synthase TruB [Nitrospira moscoviensis]|uniref:tRNA pseudouridine synthase B n=1 Tax=Nitrospira moscoviensis TaxID=42253 RepID=A0A0K2GIZ8_NITMO|nr:tRNA pseudouridine(55) synthase TruB [Nitrospira moscoviensis]ALA60854.1 tRNA pseudouridine synthase B [Nitrospira moscoviensis]
MTKPMLATMDRTNIMEQAARLDGVLIVRKEAGWTSHDVVAKIRRILGGAKVGHAGTLDPAATGVLPVLIGRATRIAEYLVDWDKEYRAVLRLGETTDTQDATGRVLERADAAHIEEAVVRAAVAKFLGPQQQVPPMYSAVKVGGRPLYKAARSGQTIERAPRPIVIHELDILDLQGRDVTLRVVCSKGTYIRTLCADIGTALGVGGHLWALERRRVGRLSIDHALTVEQVADRSAMGTLPGCLIGLDQALAQLPAVVVTKEQAGRVLHGAPIASDSRGEAAAAPGSLSVRLKDEEGRLLAIGAFERGSRGPITIQKVLAGVESLH